MCSIRNFFSAINFFKTPVRFKINKQDFYSSKSGEIMSLTIIALVLYMLLTNDVFLRINPEISERSFSAIENPSFNFSIDNFFLAIKLADGYGQAFDPDSRMFKFRAVYNIYSVKNDSQGLTPDLILQKDLIPCNTSAYKKVELYSKLLEIHPNSFCLPETKLMISGGYSQPKISKLNINLEPCKNSSENNFSCKPIEEIKTFLNGKFFGYAVLGNQVDLDNYEKPIQENFLTSFKLIVPSMRKRTLLYLEKIILKTNDGFFGDNLQEIESFKPGSEQDDFDYTNQNYIFQLLLLSSNVQKIYNRRYKKIQEVFANLGGILNFLICIGFLIKKMIPFEGMEYVLLNHLFSFKYLKEKAEPKDQKTLKCNEKFTMSVNKSEVMNSKGLKSPNKKLTQFVFKENSNLTSSIPISMKLSCFVNIKNPQTPDQIKMTQPQGDSISLSIDDYSQKQENMDQIKSQSLRNMKNIDTSNGQMKKSKTKLLMSKPITLGESLALYIKEINESKKMSFSLKEIYKTDKRKYINEKFKSIKQAKRNIMEQLDIKNFLLKFQELEKLKMILLNPQQLMLFKLTSKPELILKEESNNDKQYFSSKDMDNIEEISNEKINEVIAYYKKIQNKTIDESVDGRLLRLLDQDIKNFLKCRNNE